MRLFLSSYRFGGHEDHFLRLAGTGRRAIVIANACDAWPTSARAAAVTSDVVPLQRLGFAVRELDLRHNVDIRRELSACDVLWVRGGNTFVLRSRCARSGADEALTSMLHDDAFLYAGYSAGACLATPTLRGLESADPPQEARTTCGTDPIFDGLGLVDHAIVPHWQSPELGEAGRHVVTTLTRLGVRYWTLRDDQAVLIDGNRREFV